jgi:hypothetical protein
MGKKHQWKLLEPQALVARTNPLFSNFLFTNLFSIKFLYFFIISSLFPYFNSWSWSYGSWIYNYLCNQCLSPLILWVRISTRARCITSCDKVCQWLATGRVLRRVTILICFMLDIRCVLLSGPVNGWLVSHIFPNMDFQNVIWFNTTMKIPITRKMCLSVTCNRSGPPVSSANKTDRHDITEMLLKVALNTITLTLLIIVLSLYLCNYFCVVFQR